MDNNQLWTKDFLIDSGVNFFLYLVYYLVMIVIAVFAMEQMNASPSEAGLAAGIFIVGTLIARILAGRSIEEIGRKKVLYIGLTIYLISTFLYFQIVNLSMLLLIRFIHGVGFGIASIATGTIVANLIPNERRGEGISYYALSTTVASAIGPFLGIYLIQYESFQTIILVCIALLVVSYGAVFFLQVNDVKIPAKHADNQKRLSLDTFVEMKVMPIAFIGAIVGMCYSSIISFLSAYTKEIGLVDMGSLFFIVYSVAILISRPIGGKLFDLKGQNYVMYPAFILFAVGLLALSQAQQAASLFAAAIFIGIGFGTFLSSGQAIAIIAAPKHRVGLATATFFGIADIGVGIGPFFLGFLVPLIGFRGLYLCMAGVVIGSLYLYRQLCKKPESELQTAEKADA